MCLHVLCGNGFVRLAKCSAVLTLCVSCRWAPQEPFPKQQQQKKTLDDSVSACVCFISGKNKQNKPSTRVHMGPQMPSNANTHMHILASFTFSGWQQKSSLQAPLLLTSPLLSLSSSHYHIGQGLLIVPRQRAENGERKGIMTVRREKRRSERKEGQTGYYEREDESSEGIWSLYSPS